MMGTNSTFAKRTCVFACMAAAAVQATGCRSTRSSIANLPGMAWVGPNDEAPTFGEWDESDSTSPVAPSRDAVPQLATKSGSRSVGGRNATEAPQAPEREIATVQATYPDTGYPSPYGRAASGDSDTAGSRAGYATGSYDASAGRTGAAANSGPQRGFYGDEYQGDDGSSVAGSSRFSAEASDPSANDPTDTAANQSAASSRFSEGRFSSNSQDYGRYGETDLAGQRRALEPAGQRWAEDAQSDFEQLGRQAASDARSAVTDERDQAAQMATEVAENQRDAAEGIVDGVARDARQTYQSATNIVRDQVADRAETLAASGRELGREAEGLAHRAIGSAGQAAAGLANGIRSGYSRFSTPEDSDSQGGAGAGEQEGWGGEVATGSRYTEEMEAAESSQDPRWDSGADAQEMPPASSEEEPSAAGAYGGASDPDTQQPPARSATPWRPGSTGLVAPPTASRTERSNGTGGVAPASYQSNGASRMTSAYR